MTIPTADQVQQGHADPGRLLQECKTDRAEIDWDSDSEERYDVVGSLSGELIVSQIYGKNDLDWDDWDKTYHIKRQVAVFNNVPFESVRVISESGLPPKRTLFVTLVDPADVDELFVESEEEP